MQFLDFCSKCKIPVHQLHLYQLLSPRNILKRDALFNKYLLCTEELMGDTIACLKMLTSDQKDIRKG